MYVSVSVTQGMSQDCPRVSEGDASEQGRFSHAISGIHIGAIHVRCSKVLAYERHGFFREDVSEWASVE
jgi:hypothetical protein